MSRSYKKKLRIGICEGSNTSYYRHKRRNYRSKLKHSIFKAMQFEEPDDEYVHPEQEIFFKDSWDEPSDGSLLYRNEDLSDRVIELEPRYATYLLKLRRHIKFFHYNNWNYKKHKSNPKN